MSTPKLVHAIINSKIYLLILFRFIIGVGHQACDRSVYFSAILYVALKEDTLTEILSEK